jgi:hypothetical protein
MEKTCLIFLPFKDPEITGFVLEEFLRGYIRKLMQVSQETRFKAFELW